jgi:hypothetical protein
MIKIILIFALAFILGVFLGYMYGWFRCEEFYQIRQIK